jgi:hypothetical protein
VSGVTEGIGSPPFPRLICDSLLFSYFVPSDEKMKRAFKSSGIGVACYLKELDALHGTKFKFGCQVNG